MSNRNLSLDSLKSHLFEAIEGVKNLSDPEASENERLSIEQAKMIAGLAGNIIGQAKPLQHVSLTADIVHSADSLHCIELRLVYVDDVPGKTCYHLGLFN